MNEESFLAWLRRRFVPTLDWVDDHPMLVIIGVWAVVMTGIILGAGFATDWH